MKKKLFLFSVLICLLSITSFSVLAIDEESDNYIAGYEDGWIEGYNEAEQEYSDNYDNGYWDGYAKAEKEIREQIEEDNFSEEENNTSKKRDNLSKNIKELFSDREFVLQITMLFVGIIILIINQVLLYYDKIGSKLYTILFITGIIIASFNFVFE